MSSVEQFYDILGVSADAEPGDINEYARESVDSFRDRVENADDPKAEERKLLVAYEVLTDPEERYLYELYGHDEYVQRRLDGEELTEIEAASGSGGLTPVFGAEDDTGSNTQIFDPTEADGAETAIQDDGSDETVIQGEGGDETVIQDSADGSAATDATTIEDSEASDADTDETVIQDDEESQEPDKDGIETLEESETVTSKLSRFGVSKSPLATAPGISNQEYGHVAAAGYAVALLAVVGLIGTVLPFGSPVLGAFAASALVLGVGITYTAACYGYHRDIRTRTAIGAVAPVFLLVVPEFGLFPAVPGAVLAMVGLSVGLAGVLGANSYIEATRNNLREQRKGDTSRGGENHARTDPRSGTPDDSIPAIDILETFADEYTTRTSTVAEDLTDESTIHSTRHFVPERHIKRKLIVTDTQHNREVPASDFAAVESRLRHDVHERNNHHPTGFETATYNYLVPETVEQLTCPKCSGRTRVQCPTCSGHGEVHCSKCGGDARNQCRRCSGRGRVEDSDGNYSICSNCGGDGHNPCGRCQATGTERCSRCSGQGEITCDRCEGDGNVAQYVELIREYEPQETVSYVSHSIPEKYLTDPEGKQVQKDRSYNSNVDATEGDVFMSEHEIREIPSDVITYEYAGDLYETYEIEDEVVAPTHPRELGGRVRIFAGLSAVFALVYVYAVAVGPAGLP
ncbi:DnaJ-like cysteine-rich domain-containing protein [Halosegnis longus]|uniref:DnaJ-like cysteine-rich domain-containing protein n=1 Tax=Halosegnis longus TaxID=2216012 RepID=UPI00096A7663|nr:MULTISPECIES: hypothetical protein [Halobacteriales]